MKTVSKILIGSLLALSLTACVGSYYDYGYDDGYYYPSDVGVSVGYFGYGGYDYGHGGHWGGGGGHWGGGHGGHHH